MQSTINIRRELYSLHKKIDEITASCMSLYNQIDGSRLTIIQVYKTNKLVKYNQKLVNLSNRALLLSFQLTIFTHNDVWSVNLHKKLTTYNNMYKESLSDLIDAKRNGIRLLRRRCCFPYIIYYMFCCMLPFMVCNRLLVD